MNSKVKLTLFELGYVCLLCAYIISISNIPSGFKYVFEVTGCILLIVKIPYNKYTIKQLLVLGGIGIIFIISFITTKNELFLMTYLIVVAAGRVNFEKLIRIDMKVRFFMVVIIVFMSITGFIENKVVIRTIGQNRYSFGFQHPNLLGGMLVVFGVYYFFIKHNEFKFKDYVWELLLAILCDTIVDSRTSTFIIISIIIVELFSSLIYRLSRNDGVQKKTLKIASGLVFLFPMLSYLVSYNFDYTKPIYLALNKALNSRLYLANVALVRNPMTLFGQKIEYIPWSQLTDGEVSNAIDNLYVYVGLNFGLVTLIISIFIIFAIYIYALKLDDKKICLSILFLMMMGLVENHCFYFGQNIFLIYSAAALFSLTSFGNKIGQTR